MKKALIIGIDYYEYGNPLFGCVNDAHRVNAVFDIGKTNKKFFLFDEEYNEVNNKYLV